MLRIDRRSIQNFDWMLLGLVVVLVGFGLVNLLSATHAGVGTGTSEIFRRQLLTLGVAAAAAVGVCAIDYRRFARLAMPLYVLRLVLLLLPILLSPVVRGAQAWLFAGRVQPSELAKIGLVLALARALDLALAIALQIAIAVAVTFVFVLRSRWLSDMSPSS